MKKLIIILLLAPFAVFGQTKLQINQLNHATNNQVTPYTTISLGDSFSATYPTDLQIDEPAWNVNNKGVGGQTSYQIAARGVTYSSLWGQGVWVIEIGRNDSLLSGSKIDTTNIKTHLASILAKLPANAPYLILPIPKDTTQTNGSFGGAQIDVMNGIFQRLHPSQYADYYAYELTNGNGTPADNYNISRGITPKSKLFDNIHYNTSGWIDMAHFVDSVIKLKYFITPQVIANTDMPQLWGTPGQIGFVNPAAGNFTYIKSSIPDTVAGLYNSGSATIQGAVTLNNSLIQTYTVPSGTNNTATEKDLILGNSVISNTLNGLFVKITASGTGTAASSYLFNGSYTGTNLAGITSLGGINITGESLDHLDGKLQIGGSSGSSAKLWANGDITAVGHLIAGNTLEYTADFSGSYDSRSAIDLGYASATYAPISGSSNYVKTTGASTITPSGTSIVGLNFQGVSSQSSDFINIKNSSAVQIFRIDNVGDVLPTNVYTTNVFSTGGIGNQTSTNNGLLQTLTTGLVALSNKANSDPAFKVNNSNASSTGDLLDLQAGGSNKAVFSLDGTFTDVKYNTNGGIWYSNGSGTVFQSGAITGIVKGNGTSAPTAVGGTSSQGIAGDGTLFTLNSKPHTIFTPTTGSTVNLTNNQYNIINPAGALLALTVNLPSSPANNDCVFIKFTQNITTVTYANGTVVDGITAPTAGGLTILTYDSGATSWY